ncbi:hypothetical protein G7Z17_g3520 [Cylindrodendrum hubeiense]|uniref:Beta-xylosidase C-terminal Concanavalin A-like domain-containing protein n=1 Tax=Cylindrodendrum hubeiense TaxID=595255 RepID=A0A9P5HEM0_9HYPO|nr:hypothetical protein G7Z17_g3520 [Cylindrodendrum hubeiense]
MKSLTFLLALVPGSAAQELFTNPVLWQDLADADIIRVDDVYYYSASNMHFSPGAPILRSYDLVNWEYLSHSVPTLDFDPADSYNLIGGERYNQGIYASYFNYRKSTDTFYWGGCIVGDWKTYIYTAPSAEGPWSHSSIIDTCYYDAGLLIDDDDTMYVAHGATNISVAQLTPDGLGQVRDQVVWESPEEIGYIEGSRFYKKDGAWYIWLVKPVPDQYVLKSTEGPFGPYEYRQVLDTSGYPVTGAGEPHQGGLVTTPAGDWHYMAFVDAYPGGRIPVLAPVSWDEDGWPHVELVNNEWQATYPYPVTPHPVKSITGTDYFETLGPQYEWNHNPDNAAWSIDRGLKLKTATVTDDFFLARNTLSHRILGPQSTATVELDYSAMVDGDRAGLALFRFEAGWIGIAKTGDRTTISMVNNIAMGPTDGWTTFDKGTEIASKEISGGSIWLRLQVDVSPGDNKKGSFSYSTDGTEFVDFGEAHVQSNKYLFFMGYRYGVFNYATSGLGGAVTVKSFDISQ